MTEPRRDGGELPLDELRAAWFGVRAPLSEDAHDAATQASVEWMRAAWRAREAPAADPRVLLAHRARAERLAITRWAAAAAVVIVGIAFTLQRLAPSARQGIESGGISGLPSSSEPYIAAVAPDRIELRSGSVRLILLTNDANLQNDRPQGDRP